MAFSWVDLPLRLRFGEPVFDCKWPQVSYPSAPRGLSKIPVPVSPLLLLHGREQSGVDGAPCGWLSLFGLLRRPYCAGSLRRSLVPAYLPGPLASGGWGRLLPPTCAHVNSWLLMLCVISLSEVASCLGPVQDAEGLRCEPEMLAYASAPAGPTCEWRLGQAPFFLPFAAAEHALETMLK